MKKIYFPFIALALMAGIFLAFSKTHHINTTHLTARSSDQEEDEGYDGPAERDAFEFEQIKDPALGTVPGERLWNALEYTNALKAANDFADISVLWTERGPIYDSVGPSNGNGRGGGSGVTGGYTSGRMAAILVDTLNDPSGNTVFCGGINGGLWRCTNFLSAVPNWQLLDDYFDNMAISSICQDPTNPSIMYFATGEPTANADAVNGKGIWKSTNKGLSWVQLSGTINFIRSFKILCDKDGYVYLAARVTVASGSIPTSQPVGLLRSKNGGISWTDITPNNLTSNNVTCTDIEYTSTGWLHASFGYSTGGTSGRISYRLTNHPADASTSAGWNTIEIRHSNTVTNRLELAAIADTLYGITTNASNNVDSIYKSVNGGASWTIQDTSAVPSGVTNGQGWYNLTLAINPENTNQIVIGGLDAYKSVNSGLTLSRLTFWVGAVPYVHADHHYMQWSKIASESRIVIGCDGGIFLSRDTGRTWADRNRNLSIKQFYAADIHPTDANYLIAGAQDNGCHQLKNPGLSYSTEVTGGDGCYVHINQKKPSVQFGSYVYNQYRRSTNGGATWGSINFSGSAGLFVNPWDVDDNNNYLYASYGANLVLRIPNADTGRTASTLTITKLRRKLTDTTFQSGTPSAFKVSPYTPNRVFIGANNGKLVILDNADTVSAADAIDSSTADISGAGFSTGNIQCVNVGTSDKYLVAVFSNYGVNNVWVSNNGGTTWTAIDGNLPDMPVRWAVFQPGDNNKMLLATEAGVYTTQAIDGGSTQWMPSPGFPTVRTDMIKIRASDYYMVAATHGRGLFTSNSFSVLPLHNLKLSGALSDENKADLNWFESGATGPVKYTVQFSTDGITFKKIDDLSATRYVHDMNASVGFYRIMAVEKGQAPVFSNIVMLKTYRLVKGLQLHLAPNPVATTASLLISGATGNSNYNWYIADIQGRILQKGSGTIRENQTLTQSLDVSRLSSGLYRVRVVQNKQAAVVSFIKQ